MAESGFSHVFRTLERVRAEEEEPLPTEVISVSETVSAAATAYEKVRNTLEYDEEHLLRRNAIRRILKRRIGETEGMSLARDLLRELIWARYLPNKRVPETMAKAIADLLEKYAPLFEAARLRAALPQVAHEWLLDLASVEIEYLLMPPRSDEALASYAYQALKERVVWSTAIVKEEERDLQLYVAVHRTVLKSNRATLRFRLLTLYYPAWTKARAHDALISEIAGELPRVVQAIEGQIMHPAADAIYRLVRKHAVVFQVMADAAKADPHAFEDAVHTGNTHAADALLVRATDARYRRFRARLKTSVFRAVGFLLLTKMLLAMLIEAPYEWLILHSTYYTPLLVNILFHPFLLAVIGLTVGMPEKKNTDKIVEEVHALFGWGDDFELPIKLKRPWNRGVVGAFFQVFYALFFLLTVAVIAGILLSFHFNGVSIAFFLFFLMLVMFFGLKIRNSKRQLIIIDSASNIFGTIFDILFLPVVSAGRWISLRAPKVNIFLFFFDFIVEAPFKAAIAVIEGWLAFVREKKEEI